MINNGNMQQIMQLLQQTKNPQQAVIQLLERQSANNPIVTNLLGLAKQNKTAEIEQIVRNLFQQQGLDFDTEFNSFKRNLGL